MARQGGPPLRDTITRVLRSYGLSRGGHSAAADSVAPTAPAAPEFTDTDFDAAAWDRGEWQALSAAGVRRVVMRRLPSAAIPLSPHEPDAPMYRAVIAAPQDPDRHELQQLHDQGARGVRFGLNNAADPHAMLSYADRIVTLGWHVEIGLPAVHKTRPLENAEWVLTQMPVSVCFSGVAGFVAERSPDDAELTLLLDLVSMGRFWLKISGAEVAAAAAPARETLGRFVEAMMAVRDDRLVWGTGSAPHPTDVGAHVASALDTLSQWVPDSDRRNRILWSNAATLYRF